MSQELGTFFVFVFMGLGVVAAALYCLNIYRIIVAVRTENYNILLGGRIVGIFVPIWGVILGCINDR